MSSATTAEGRAATPAERGAGGGAPTRVWVGRFLLVILAGGLFGWWGAVSLPEEHVARAVLVLVTVDDEDSAARATATQVALLTGDAVLGPVAERVRTPREELGRAVDVEADPDTSLIRVDVAAGDPVRARLLLSEVLTEYLAVGYAADFPVDGLVRVRLVLPPHAVEQDAPTAGGGAATGAAIGAVVALAVASSARARAVGSRATRRRGPVARTAVRDSVTVAGWTLVSRVSGLLRVVLAGAVLGPTYFGNLFQTVYVLPALVYSTVAGPVLSMVLVPAVVAAAERRGAPAARSVCAGIGGWVLAVSAAAAALVAVGSPAVAGVLTLAVPAEADPARAGELATIMVLFAAPQILLYTVASLGIAAQHAGGRFGLAAAAPAVENVGLMATVVSAGLIWGAGREVGAVPVEMVVLLGAGSTLAVGLHALLQVVGAARCGMLALPSRSAMRSAEAVDARRRLVRSVGVAAWPSASMFAVLSCAGTVPGGVVVVQIGYAVYNAATYLTGRAVATAALPRLSRAVSTGDSEQFAAQWRQGLGHALMASAPLLVLLTVLAGPLAGLLVRGELSEEWVLAALTGVLVVVAFAQVLGGVHDLGRQALFAGQRDDRPRRASELAILATLVVAAASFLVPAGPARLVLLAVAVLAGELAGMVVVLASVRGVLDGRRLADPHVMAGTARAAAVMTPLAILGAWWHASAVPGPLAAAGMVAGTGLVAVALYAVALRAWVRPVSSR